MIKSKLISSLLLTIFFTTFVHAGPTTYTETYYTPMGTAYLVTKNENVSLMGDTDSYHYQDAIQLMQHYFPKLEVLGGYNTYQVCHDFAMTSLLPNFNVQTNLYDQVVGGLGNSPMSMVDDGSYKISKVISAADMKNVDSTLSGSPKGTIIILTKGKNGKPLHSLIKDPHNSGMAISKWNAGAGYGFGLVVRHKLSQGAYGSIYQTLSGFDNNKYQAWQNLPENEKDDLFALADADLSANNHFTFYIPDGAAKADFANVHIAQSTLVASMPISNIGTAGSTLHWQILDHSEAVYPINKKGNVKQGQQGRVQIELPQHTTDMTPGSTSSWQVTLKNLNTGSVHHARIYKHADLTSASWITGNPRVHYAFEGKTYTVSSIPGANQYQWDVSDIDYSSGYKTITNSESITVVAKSKLATPRGNGPLEIRTIRVRGVKVVSGLTVYSPWYQASVLVQYINPKY